MKKYLSFGVIVAIIIAVGAYFAFKPEEEPRRTGPVDRPILKDIGSPLNTTYEIEGEKITLVNGKTTEDIVSGPGATITTEIFGEPVYGNMGVGDTAVSFLVQQGGGTGTFVYAVAAYKVNGEYKGAKAFFLGDRVAPQNIRIVNDVAEVNYATRKNGEPMSAEPSLGVTKYLVLKNGELVEK